MANRMEHRALWTKTVQGWKRSGLTQVAFAEREGIAVATLRAWCGRLGMAPRPRRHQAPPVGPRFVEVRAAPPVDRMPLELHLGAELFLRFGGDVSPEFVGAVVAAVRGRPC